MSCIDCPPEIQTLGADPAIVNWKVIRGDTATLRVLFLENDETTSYDTSGWVYESTAYNPLTTTSYTLNVTAQPGYADITASAETTTEWGTGKSGTVASLEFDLQVTFEDDTVWTPVVGTINVYADTTLYGGL